jgi:hypothetical protein
VQKFKKIESTVVTAPYTYEKAKLFADFEANLYTGDTVSAQSTPRGAE